ncbi:MAG: thiamine phosphate synthase [Actinomycetota bacterium]|nr:thiamine phosphate synthase [Actinomycetota bacterium]
MLPRIHVITELPCTPPAVIDEIVGMGVDAIQVRAKDLTDRELFDFTVTVIRTVGARAKVIVNDRLDIALASGADGVHLGLTDLPVARARRLAPEGFLVGGTCRNVVDALRAKEDGADYVGVGPIYPSTTKTGLPDPIGLSTLGEIARLLPVIAISGITLERIPQIMAAGAHGVAVIAAVSRAPDPARAAREVVDAVQLPLVVR